MARIEKTVFISYRRKDISWALAVYQDLTHQGYDVFFDYTSIPSGDFEQIIISNIKARAHFVLILTPTTLDRCNESGDWLRREIENAIDEKRNIIPVFFDGFSFGNTNVSEKLTGKLKNVSRYNGMNVHHDYFLEAMERLRTKFLNIPLEAILHPVSTEVQEVVKEEKLAANNALLQSQKEKPIIETPKTPPVGRVSNPTTTAPSQPSQAESLTYATPVQEKKPVIETPKPAKVITPPNKLILSNGMEFMRVPAGKFLMGEKSEQPPVDIPYDYWMARFPVTNEQYNVYAKVKGISHPISDWEKKKDHPVANVIWNTVMEYCQWLNSLLKAELPSGLALRLPTEAEWEKAARGADGREYPWGNTFDKNKCNSREGGKGGTTSVGMYSPQGDSPYGCADMSGNVWEWTHSEYKAYPYNEKDGREDEQKSVARVVRGGAVNFVGSNLRCAYRVRDYPYFRHDDYGFRVVVSSFPISLLRSGS
jgi:formylglycine-generating enzyme required for sulfatase activity